MRFHLVVNPRAGRGRAGALAQATAHALGAAGHGAQVHTTQSGSQARAHVAGLEPTALDRLIVVGGDGTLRAALNARPLPLPWPVGLVPVGTANVVGRELRMPLTADASATARALGTAEPFAANLLELVRPDGAREVALANVGAGLDAAIVAAVDRARAQRPGSGGYGAWVGPIVRTLARYRAPRLRVTLNGTHVYESAAAVVQGARAYGGLFRLAPQARLDSSSLHVSLVEARTARDLLRVLTRALLRRAHRDAGLRTFPAHSVLLEADEALPLQADGDAAGTTPVVVRLLPRAVVLLRAAGNGFA